MPDSIDAESAVRRYMAFLADPDSARDGDAIAAAEADLAKAKDPIDALRAEAALERARTADGSELRAAFVRHARSWAQREGISAAAFRNQNVPEEDLVAAGIVDAGKGRRSRGRAPRLDVDEVAGKLPKGTFTLRDFAEAIDREPGTARRYVQQLVDRGTVTDLGDDPNHDGRGRAPRLYKRA